MISCDNFQTDSKPKPVRCNRTLKACNDSAHSCKQTLFTWETPLQQQIIQCCAMQYNIITTLDQHGCRVLQSMGLYVSPTAYLDNDTSNDAEERGS